SPAARSSSNPELSSSSSPPRPAPSRPPPPLHPPPPPPGWTVNSDPSSSQTMYQQATIPSWREDELTSNSSRKCSHENPESSTVCS
ncbi:unnamed protein product, partial [Strongylus vulgaris]